MAVWNIGQKKGENKMSEKIERKCEVCNQFFNPMTEEQWKIVKYEHETMSERHKNICNLKGILKGARNRLSPYFVRRTTLHSHSTSFRSGSLTATIRKIHCRVFPKLPNGKLRIVATLCEIAGQNYP